MTERPSSVRLFPVDHPVLANTLRAKLHKLRESLIEQLGKGYAIDWPDYNKRVGTIMGVESTIKLCEDSERELNGES